MASASRLGGGTTTSQDVQAACTLSTSFNGIVLGASGNEEVPLIVAVLLDNCFEVFCGRLPPSSSDVYLGLLGTEAIRTEERVGCCSTSNFRFLLGRLLDADESLKVILDSMPNSAMSA